MPARPTAFPDPSVLSRVLVSPATLTNADLPHVRAAGLSGAVRAMLPGGHAMRATLRQDALNLALRHSHIRAEVRPLLAAWASEGIPAMLIKGFAVAEFEYATPAERFYGDVDVLLPPDPDSVLRAAHLAIALGWRSDGQHADPERWTHETMHLFSPGGHVRLDVHRYAVATIAGLPSARAAQITAGVWQRATIKDWDGVPVVRSHPLDATVVNVALGRSWGGDTGGIKPADYLDLANLTQRHGLTASALSAHAERMGATHTWAAFCAACDPFNQHLNLQMAQPTSKFTEALSSDGLHHRAWRWQSRGHTLRHIWPVLPQALLDVIAAWWVIRKGGDPRMHLRRWTPDRPTRRLPLAQLTNWLDAVGWWTRLFYPRQRRLGICVPRAYASYRALRRAGHPAVFISGVARRNGGITGHAWIEDDQGEIELYGEPHNRRTFKEVFTFPAQPG